MHRRGYFRSNGKVTPRFVSEEVANEETTDKLSTTSEILLLVLPLLLVYISNQWSRFSISYLVEFPIERDAHVSMNADIGFTEAQYGILASTAFTILFAISSLFAGNLADKYDRKILTLISCAVWTLATFSQSIAHSYEEVLIARFLMGGACAFAAPCAYSLIADKVTEERTALANSIYATGVYLGGALASLSLLIDDMIGWRDTMMLTGCYGLLSVAISSFTLPFERSRSETKRCNNIKENDSSSLTRDVIKILSNPRVQYLLLASFFRFSAGLIIAIWAPPYYKQAFPNNSSEYAVLNALIKGGIGMASGISGGFFAGFLKQIYQKDSSEGKTSIVNKYFDDDTILLMVPIFSSLLAIPTWYLATHSPQGETAFELSMFWLAVEYLVAECWFGPTIAVLQSSVEPSIRGTSQGLFVLVGALGNVSPSFLGWVYGNKTQFPLADLLSVSVCGGYLMSSLFFVASVGRKEK